MMYFEELDKETRKWMVKEFENEWTQQSHFKSKQLNEKGLEEFPKIIKNALCNGTIESLTKDLTNSSFWKPSYIRRGKKGPINVSINPATEAKKLAHSEFTTWYTRGFARRLKEEGITECEIYRADKANIPKCECTALEGTKQYVDKIYNGHRAKYFPKDNPSAFSIPSVSYCHHTIRRIKT